MDPCCIAIESNFFTHFSGRMCDDPFRFDWRSVHNRTFSAGVAPLPTRLFGVVLFPLLRFLGSSLLTAFLASRGFSDRLVARLIRPPMSHLSCVMLTPRLGHDAATKQCRLKKKSKKKGCAACCCCGGVEGAGDEGVAGTGLAPAAPLAAALRSSSRIARMRRAVG